MGKYLPAFLRLLNLQCPLVSPDPTSGGHYEERTERRYQNLVSKFKELRLILSRRKESTPRARFSFVESADSIKRYS